jgi:hypothetical protein
MKIAINKTMTDAPDAPKRLRIRLSESEYEQLQARAQDAKVSPQTWCKRRVIEHLAGSQQANAEILDAALKVWGALETIEDHIFDLDRNPLHGGQSILAELRDELETTRKAFEHVLYGGKEPK